MDTWEPTLSTGPLLGIAVAAIAVTLVLVIYFKLHAFLTLLVVSALTALAAGIPLDGIVPTMTESFSSTLGSVALLVGLGAMIGRLVEASGGAKSLADAMVRRFGESKAPLALGLASLIMGFPIFFDAGLIVMLPVIFAVARRLNGPVLAFGLPAAPGPRCSQRILRRRYGSRSFSRTHPSPAHLVYLRLPLWTALR